MRHIKLPEDVPFDLTRFWIMYADQWEPCSHGECYMPVLPELRLMAEPLCAWHRITAPPVGRAGGRR